MTPATPLSGPLPPCPLVPDDKHRLRDIAGEMDRSVQALKEAGCEDADLLAGNAKIASDLRVIAHKIAEAEALWRKLAAPPPVPAAPASDPRRRL